LLESLVLVSASPPAGGLRVLPPPHGGCVAVPRETRRLRYRSLRFANIDVVSLTYAFDSCALSTRAKFPHWSHRIQHKR